MKIEIEDKQLGRIIRDYRHSHHLTQEQLSELAGCSSGFIGQMERGESMPSVSILRNIIRALDINANNLFWPTEEFSTEDQQLINQIHHYISHMSTKEKNFVLSVISHMDILK